MTTETAGQTTTAGGEVGTTDTAAAGEGRALQSLESDLGKLRASEAEDVAQTSDQRTEAGTKQQATDAHARVDLPALTPQQIEAVKQAGLDPAEIAAMGDKGVKVAERLAKQRANHDRMATQLGQVMAEVKGLKAGAASAVKAPSESSSADDLTLTAEDDFDAIVQKFNALSSTVREMGVLKAKVSELEAGVSASAEERKKAQAKESAEFFNQLDPTIWDQFGQGDPEDGSPEFLARTEVDDEAQEIVRRLTAKGRKISLAQGHWIALSAFHPEQYEQAAIRKAADLATARRRGSMEPATGRTSAARAKDPKQAALEKLEEQLKQVT